MSFDLVLFGGTGDLTWRKLMPALFQAFRHGKLPPGGRIVSVARDERSDDQYRAFIKERFVEVDSAKRPNDDEFARFAEMLHYRRMDLSKPEDYAGLKGLLDARNADTVVLFLATSPHLFPQICAQLGAVGLNGPNVRVVLEKPLGHDLESAREINRAVSASFREEQALRIDHYLGKPAVQNLSALRFGNVLFEPLWRRESIANIQITLAESIGVGTRGDFYDRTGALRDMIQNHALQLLTMVAMEPPATNDANAIRDEKLKVLKSLKPFTEESVARDVIRGQYRAGNSEGKKAIGYLDEAKVPAGSPCETFVALRTEVQNWRWAGVPFYLRTGKRLAARDAQIVVNFRPTPHTIFPGVNRPNKLVIKLQPEDGLELHLQAAKGSSQSEALAPVSLDLDFDKAFASDRIGGYERLLMDAIAGRLNLFVRSDEQEQAWHWVEPILDAWKRDDTGPRAYAAGTWGPAAASALVARDGFAWSEEQKAQMLDRIRASIPALPPAEQRVAKLVLLDPRTFASLPVTQLAERSHVSKPTVVRFCRSVGYDGLADFKRKLAGSVNEGVPFVHRAVDEDDKPGDIVVKVIDNAVSAFLKYRNDAASHAFERAIAALAEAGIGGRRIEFYGVGNSGIVAQDAQHKFFRLGVTTAAVSDGHVQVMSATMLKPGDCAVIISNSGHSRDLIDVAEIARKRGATTIVITASGSVLAQAAQTTNQILLAVDHPENYDRYSPMVSRLLHLLVIDILTTAVALRLPGELRQMLQEIKKNLRVRRYARPE